MKTKFILLTALVAMSQTAIAQTSTTTAPAADAAAANASAASASVAPLTVMGVQPEVKYLGIMRGPGLEFSGAHQATNNSNGDLNFEHRVKFLGKASDTVEAGLETRTNTMFGNGNNLHASAGNWRLLANIKHVYQDSILDVTLTPRIVLPTSTKLRNQKATLSPDMIADFAIAPKNSRFSIDAGAEYIHFLHTDGANYSDSQAALTAIVAPWLEVDYQLTAKTQLMISYWPELIAEARKGTPLHSDSNEIDLGAYYEFAKGWQVNPFIATETFGMDTTDVASVQKNMQLNILFIGTIL